MASMASVSIAANTPIIHDAEHYVLLGKYGDEWKKEDKNAGYAFEGISNLRPETKAMLSGYLDSRKLLKK